MQVQLRDLFPCTNLSMMIAKRPSLLLGQEFSAIATAHAKLHEMFPEGGVDRMVEQQPLLLVEDVDAIVGEIERCVAAALLC